MYKGKLRYLLFVFIFLYTAIILYFMFVGLGRTRHLNSGDEYVYAYNLIPYSITFFPGGHYDDLTWLINLGNLIAFIPYGVLIPLLIRCGFVRFVVSFLTCIVVLEITQMLTQLGSFDINDVILNSMGAAIGYGAFKVTLLLMSSVKLNEHKQSLGQSRETKFP